MSRSALDVAFVVQGEGRGHMTQALAARDFLTEAGHRVVAVHLGTSPVHPAPAYFQERMEAPVFPFLAPTLVPDGEARGMSLARTVAYNGRHLPAFVRSGLTLRRRLRRQRPDVVVNFFDLVAGLVHAASWRPRPPPRVALAHTYLLRHPATATPSVGVTGRWGLEALCALSALGSGTPLGLSFDPLPSAPGVRPFPPLLRRGLDEVTPTDGGYLLAYALNPGYVRDLARWQARRAEVEVHCYAPGGADGSAPDQPGFTVHGLDDEAFLHHLAACRAYVGTAGFESVCEAHYLGKPLLAVPVGRHFEQAFNGADIRRAGMGRTGSFQELDAFWDDLPTPSTAQVDAFRRWVGRAPELLVQAVEEAAARKS